jgi:inosose dehydratase
MKQHGRWSRRSVLIGSVAGVVGVAAGHLPSARGAIADVTVHKVDDPWRGLKVGVATYTLSKVKTDDAIKAIVRVSMKYCSIKEAHLPLKSTAEERKAVVEKFKAAGITPISVGNITLKNDEAQVRAMFEYARDVGVPVMVCAPDKASLPICERMVKQFNIKMAIHNHGPEDKNFPSPYDVMKAVESMDERIGCCIDVGHCARAGVDPAEAILKVGRRVYDCHMKDVARLDRPSTVECGRGILDIKGIAAALLKVEMAGHVGFEHEKDMENVVPGLAECVGYVKGIMAGM